MIKSCILLAMDSIFTNGNKKAHMLRPNQSLKLTEGAVDDFTARCWTDLRASDWYVRAMNYMELTVGRRSLAPVR